MDPLILPIVYGGNITYYRHLLSGKPVILDRHEHYVKRSYRTRCVILGPNGVQNLSIPVHGGTRTPMNEVTIDRSENWQENHWRSLDAAYASSPFFLHYAPLLEPLYQRDYERLADFNLDLQNRILEILSTTVDVSLSDHYVEPSTGEDLRDQFKPSSESPLPHPSYIQVFTDRHPFIPNLSVLDPIFNLGPEARNIIIL